MKKIVLIAGLLALAACSKSPEPGSQTSDMIVTDDSILNQIPRACGTDGKMCQKSTPEEVADTNESLSENELDEASAEQIAQQEADEAENNPISIVNTGNTNRNYVLRDAATGCEFIQFDDTGTDGTSLPIVARPNGRGGQRGCGTGTDFKK